MARDPIPARGFSEIFGGKNKLDWSGWGRVDGQQHLSTPGLVPTLILNLPLLQLGFYLVQHHGQLPKDLLQVIHIIMLQDLGLGTG